MKKSETRQIGIRVTEETLIQIKALAKALGHEYTGEVAGRPPRYGVHLSETIRDAVAIAYATEIVLAPKNTAHENGVK